MDLTEREQQVLQGVVRGHTSREIAEELGLSPKTIQTHREHIMKKMGCHRAVDLVRKVIGGLHEVA
jgi:DNA-binding NarL/FixJ family response regulator